MNPASPLYLDDRLVDNVVSYWRAGQLVAIPTETVYGLGADATNGEAVARIYAAKTRPQFNPLIVHVADVATAQRYVVWHALAERLAAQYWPGPLTLVLPKRADSPISSLVSAGGDTLAIRMPAHPVALQLLRAFGGGIAAPSANRSGRVSPTTAAHVRAEFGESLLVVDGGPCTVGLESTVLDLTGEHPVILRPGGVSRAALEAQVRERKHVSSRPERSEAAGSIFAGDASDPGVTASAGMTTSTPLRSPGQLASHYAPSVPVRLHAMAVADGEALLAFGSTVPLGAAMTLNLSPTGDLIEAAANLFSHLRALDHPRYAAIAVMPIPAKGIGEAINDRLARAAVRP